MAARRWRRPPSRRNVSLRDGHLPAMVDSLKPSPSLPPSAFLCLRIPLPLSVLPPSRHPPTPPPPFSLPPSLPPSLLPSLFLSSSPSLPPSLPLACLNQRIKNGGVGDATTVRRTTVRDNCTRQLYGTTVCDNCTRQLYATTVRDTQWGDGWSRLDMDLGSRTGSAGSSSNQSFAM
jgi:hypothetical protein